MERASVNKCLRLLRELREAVKELGEAVKLAYRWPELVIEIDEIIFALETEIRRAKSSSKKEMKLDDVVSRAIWFLSKFFGNT